MRSGTRRDIAIVVKERRLAMQFFCPACGTKRDVQEDETDLAVARQVQSGCGLTCLLLASLLLAGMILSVKRVPEGSSNLVLWCIRYLRAVFQRIPELTVGELIIVLAPMLVGLILRYLSRCTTFICRGCNGAVRIRFYRGAVLSLRVAGSLANTVEQSASAKQGGPGGGVNQDTGTGDQDLGSPKPKQP